MCAGDKMKYGHEVLKCYIPWGFLYKHKLYLEFKVLGAEFEFFIKWSKEKGLFDDEYEESVRKGGQ